MRGAKPPAIIFVWPSPTRVGAAEDEVMEVMIYWGSGTAPASGLSPRRILHQRLFHLCLFMKEMFIFKRFPFLFFQAQFLQNQP